MKSILHYSRLRSRAYRAGYMARGEQQTENPYPKPVEKMKLADLLLKDALASTWTVDNRRLFDRLNREIDSSDWRMWWLGREAFENRNSKAVTP